MEANKTANAKKMYPKVPLKCHMVRMYSNVENTLVSCDICYVKVQERYLSMHKARRHNTGDKKHKCNVCSHKAHTKTEINTHAAQRHSTGEKKHKCEH
jgi:hypothetical protein